MQKKTLKKSAIDLSDSLVFKKNPDMVTRKIEGETILVPIFKASDDLNCIYTLNNCASRIWDMIDGKNSIDNIKDKMLKEFDTNEKEAERELKSLFKDLKEIKAVI
ncbi:MAG: PqqD family protein [Candidatus Omnitrophota bacterium]